MSLAAADIKVNHWYRAKRFREGVFRGNNDRIVLYMDRFAIAGNEQGQVQYDSDTVPEGRHYPTTTLGAFLRWADTDITPIADTAGEQAREPY